MEALTYKCLDCGAALRFDTEAGQLYCEYCVQYFPAELFKEIGEQADKPAAKVGVWNVPASGGRARAAWEGPTEEEKQRAAARRESEEMTAEAGEEERIGTAKMDVRIYRCSSCGAEVMTGDAEVSRVCSFCGNPTILFDRVSEENRPDKIIPFKMAPEEALRRVKEKFKKALYLESNPEDIKTDSIYPIYMPYWVYTAYHSVTATVTVETKEGRIPHFDAVSGVETVPMDASGKFQDDISILLNPYRLEEAEDFNMAYLSGFYADRSDVGPKAREVDARIHLRRRAIETILNRTPGVPKPGIRRALGDKYRNLFTKYAYSTANENFDVRKVEYMFLPVYFITFRVNNTPVIILVNGQTGKIVGNIPVDVGRVQKRQIVDSVIGGIVGAVLTLAISLLVTPIHAAVLAIAAAPLLYHYGKKSKDNFLIRYYRTNSNYMFELSEDRK